MNNGQSSFMDTLKKVWKWVYRLRSVILSIPVAAGAVILALFNQINLPSSVGINLQANGEYAQIVVKTVAVLGPLAVTTVCLALVFCSRKVLYPWLVSVFSLALPIMIYLINIPL